MDDDCSNCSSVTVCTTPTSLQLKASYRFNDLLFDDTPCSLMADHMTGILLIQPNYMEIPIKEINLSLNYYIQCQLCHSNVHFNTFLTSKYVH